MPLSANFRRVPGLMKFRGRYYQSQSHYTNTTPHHPNYSPYGACETDEPPVMSTRWKTSDDRRAQMLKIHQWRAEQESLAHDTNIDGSGYGYGGQGWWSRDASGPEKR